MAALGLLVWKKKCLEVRFEGVQRLFPSDGKGKVTSGRGAENRKRKCLEVNNTTNCVLFSVYLEAKRF